MLSAIYANKKHNEEGFTLLELLIVVIVIGILAAIALPIFLNQQRAAVDASVQSDVRNSVAQLIGAQATKDATFKPTVSREKTTLSLVDTTSGDTSSATGADASPVLNTPADGDAFTLNGYNSDGGKFQGASVTDGKTFAYDGSTGKFSDGTAPASGNGSGDGSNGGNTGGGTPYAISGTPILRPSSNVIVPGFNSYYSTYEETNSSDLYTDNADDPISDLPSVTTSQRKTLTDLVDFYQSWLASNPNADLSDSATVVQLDQAMKSNFGLDASGDGNDYADQGYAYAPDESTVLLSLRQGGNANTAAVLYVQRGAANKYFAFMQNGYAEVASKATEVNADGDATNPQAVAQVASAVWYDTTSGAYHTGEYFNWFSGAPYGEDYDQWSSFKE